MSAPLWRRRSATAVRGEAHHPYPPCMSSWRTGGVSGVVAYGTLKAFHVPRPVGATRTVEAFKTVKPAAFIAAGFTLYTCPAVYTIYQGLSPHQKSRGCDVGYAQGTPAVGFSMIHRRTLCITPRWGDCKPVVAGGRKEIGVLYCLRLRHHDCNENSLIRTPGAQRNSSEDES